jgi:ABC-type branched-subunit amino acid transport system substrate-binding protein
MPSHAICIVRAIAAMLAHVAPARRDGTRRPRWSRLLALLLLAACAAARAEPGVYPERIVIGQSIGLSGPLASFAASCGLGARAYFSEINAQGGIYGRKIELLTRDDGYDIDAARQNTERFIREDRVFALFGSAGWPGVDASLPIATKARVPFLFPCTGASSLYSGFNRYVFTLRASYAREYRYLLRMFRRFGVRSVAVLYQSSARGLLGDLDAQSKALGISAIAVEADPNDNLQAAILRIMALAPDAVLLINGDSTANAAVVRGLRERGYNGRFFGASAIGQRALADALGPAVRGMIVTQVAPSPWHASIPLVADYRKLMESQGIADFSFAGMEGFIAARVFVEALRRAGRNPTREKLVAALESINEKNFDHRGFPVNFSATNHQGADFIEATVMAGDAAFIN